VLVTTGNPAIRLYEINSTSNDPQQQQQAVLTLEGHTGNVTSIGFQRDGRYLYSGSDDGTIKIWDLRNPNYSRSIAVGAPVNSVCLRSDRDEFTSGDQDGYVKVWDLSGKKEPLVSIKPSAVDDHSFDEEGEEDDDDDDDEGDEDDNNNKNSKNSKEGDGEKSVKSSAAIKRAAKRKSNGHESVAPIQAVDISEDSRTLVAVSNHGTVYVWDPSMMTTSSTSTKKTSAEGSNTMMQLRGITKFRAHPIGSYCLHARIAPDCRHLVTTSSDGTAKLWDTVTWDCSQTLVHTKWVWDAAFCADSSYLVTASSDHIGRLWNLRSGDVVRLYHGHQSAVTAVALNDSSV
jgi:G protein beta subunit-like protein